MNDRSVSINEKLRNLIITDLESPRIPAGDGRIFFRHAKGPYIEDIDGNRYIDFSNGLGSVLLGHNDPEVNNQLISALTQHWQVMTGLSRFHIDVAEQIVQDMEGEYAIGFFSSGTAALRASTSAMLDYSKRPLVLSAGYHGWDPFWSPSSDLLEPNSNGVIDFFFCLDYLDTLIRRHRDDIAGVVLSPDFLYLDETWYEEIFMLCRNAELFILLDEVKQGYRYGPGSRLHSRNFCADMYVFGKCLANGYPLACVVSQKEILESIRNMTSTGYHFLLPFVAAKTTLNKLVECDVQKQIRLRGDKFLSQLKKRISEVRLPIQIVGNGNLFQFVHGDCTLEEAFYHLSTKRGIIFFEGDNQTPSFAFSDLIFEEALSCLTEVLDELAHRFPGLIDTEVPQEEKWKAALRTMEGFPGHQAPKEAREKFLRQHVFH